MDIIIEELFRSLIKRIEELEGKVNTNFSTKKVSNQGLIKDQSGTKSGMASPGQLKYIGILKGNIWEDMTKNEAGAEIDRCLKLKEKKKETDQQQINTTDDIDSMYGVLTDQQIKESKEGVMEL